MKKLIAQVRINKDIITNIPNYKDHLIRDGLREMSEELFESKYFTIGEISEPYLHRNTLTLSLLAMTQEEHKVCLDNLKALGDTPTLTKEQKELVNRVGRILTPEH